jgi:hypothetical protein
MIDSLYIVYKNAIAAARSVNHLPAPQTHPYMRYTPMPLIAAKKQ